MKTSELQGAALDWAVAKCEGNMGHKLKDFWLVHMEDPVLQYSINWAQGGPIIEREGINLTVGLSIYDWWAVDDGGAGSKANGPTPLIAAMRCYVASKLGEEVEIPEDLK